MCWHVSTSFYTNLSTWNVYLKACICKRHSSYAYPCFESLVCNHRCPVAGDKIPAQKIHSHEIRPSSKLTGCSSCLLLSVMISNCVLLILVSCWVKHKELFEHDYLIFQHNCQLVNMFFDTWFQLLASAVHNYSYVESELVIMYL